MPFQAHFASRQELLARAGQKLLCIISPSTKGAAAIQLQALLLKLPCRSVFYRENHELPAVSRARETGH
nr:MAG TPA: protein of unknown function DUF3786 [Caudoviricetes sp.]